MQGSGNHCIGLLTVEVGKLKFSLDKPSFGLASQFAFAESLEFLEFLKFEFEIKFEKKRNFETH